MCVIKTIVAGKERNETLGGFMSDKKEMARFRKIC
jgi:hypothetical protein